MTRKMLALLAAGFMVLTGSSFAQAEELTDGTGLEAVEAELSDGIDDVETIEDASEDTAEDVEEEGLIGDSADLDVPSLESAGTTYSSVLYDIPIQVSYDYDSAFQVLELVNQERKKQNLSELSMDKELLETAMMRAAETAVYFDHTRPNGELCFSASSKMMGENIAAGQSSASSVMYSWMNSSGHKANILGGSYTSIGVGAVTVNGVHYWVQAFGTCSADTATASQYKNGQALTYVKTNLAQAGNDSFQFTLRENTSSNETKLTLYVYNTFAQTPIVSEGISLDSDKVLLEYPSRIQYSNLSFTYNGTNRKPSVTVLTNKGNVISASNYSVEYPEESKYPGTYSLNIGLEGDFYSATITQSYTVEKANQTIALSDVTKRLDNKTYTLTAQITQGNKTGKFTYTSDNPQVATVTSGGKITFTGVGEAKITATTKETANYKSASKTITLTVLPAPTVVTQVANNGAGWLNIQWRISKEADGYQVQYATNKEMKGAKSASITKNSTRSYTRKDVQKGQTYYVRVRTYKVVNGKRYYSNWSGTKSVTIKN